MLEASNYCVYECIKI